MKKLLTLLIATLATLQLAAQEGDTAAPVFASMRNTPAYTTP